MSHNLLAFLSIFFFIWLFWIVFQNLKWLIRVVNYLKTFLFFWGISFLFFTFYQPIFLFLSHFFLFLFFFLWFLLMGRLYENDIWFNCRVLLSRCFPLRLFPLYFNFWSRLLSFLTYFLWWLLCLLLIFFYSCFRSFFNFLRKFLC